MPESFVLHACLRHRGGRHQGYSFDAIAETFNVLDEHDAVVCTLHGLRASVAVAQVDEVWDAWVDERGDLAHLQDREFRDRLDEALDLIAIEHDHAIPAAGAA